MLLATDQGVTLDTVRLALPRPRGSGSMAQDSGPLAERVQSFERDVIMAELARRHYHVTNTAKALGLERSHLYKKAEQLGIELRAQRGPQGGTGRDVTGQDDEK